MPLQNPFQPVLVCSLSIMPASTAFMTFWLLISVLEVKKLLLPFGVSRKQLIRQS